VAVILYVQSNGNNPLIEAAKNNFHEVVKYLLQKSSIDINAKTQGAQSARDTALLVAVVAATSKTGTNNASVLLLLEDSKIDITITNMVRNQACHVRSQLNYAHVFQDGNTALHLACSTGNIAVAKRLCEMGASTGLRNNVGPTNRYSLILF
jgi:ankyrin repeat protein